MPKGTTGGLDLALCGGFGIHRDCPPELPAATSTAPTPPWVWADNTSRCAAIRYGGGPQSGPQRSSRGEVRHPPGVPHHSRHAFFVALRQVLPGGPLARSFAVAGK